jgi:hypothetical protein
VRSADAQVESSPGFVDTRFIWPAVQTSQATRSSMTSEVYRGCAFIESKKDSMKALSVTLPGRFML